MALQVSRTQVKIILAAEKYTSVSGIVIINWQRCGLTLLFNKFLGKSGEFTPLYVSVLRAST